MKKKTKVVYGSRVLGREKKNYKSKYTSNIRILANYILTLLSNLINNQSLTDAHTCYKVFDTKIFKKISLNEKDFRFCPEVTCKISRLGEKIIEIPIKYNGRKVTYGYFINRYILCLFSISSYYWYIFNNSTKIY